MSPKRRNQNPPTFFSSKNSLSLSRLSENRNKNPRLFFSSENRLSRLSEMATAMAEDNSFEDDQISSMSSDDIVRASRPLDNEIRILRV